MMLPAHVGGLDDALFYLRDWVEWLGAVDRSLEQPVTGLLHRDRLARVVLLPTEFRFAGGRRLAARATIGPRRGVRPAWVAPGRYLQRGARRGACWATGGPDRADAGVSADGEGSTSSSRWLPRPSTRSPRSSARPGPLHGAPDGDPEDAGRRAAATASAGQAWAADAGPFYDPQRPVTGWTITAWLTSPDPDLDGLTPVELLQADRPDPVITDADDGAANELSAPSPRSVASAGGTVGLRC